MSTNFIKKNSLCKYYMSYGDCFHGDNCQYIHSRDPNAPMIGPESVPQSQQHHQQPHHNQHHQNHHQHQQQQQTPQAPQIQQGAVFPTSAAAAVTANLILPGASFTMSEETKALKDGIFQRQQATADATESNLMPGDTELLESLPERVQDYVDLYPIKRPATTNGRSNLLSNSLGFVNSIYRATNLNTNQTVCLRRVHSIQPNGANAKSLLATIEAWRKIHCANIVRLLQVFTTKEFGDNSLIFVYQHFPQSTTLMQHYFNDPQSAGLGSSANSIFSATNRPYSQQHAILKTKLLPENLLWHYIIQISSSLRLIHSQGLAYRILDPSKILITTNMPKCPPAQLQPTQYPRIRLNACGLFDVVSHDYTVQDQTNNMKGFYQQLQQDDLVSFGRLCLALATNSLANARKENWETAMELVSRTYSGDLKGLIVTLLSAKQQASRRTINDIMPMIGARFYVQLNLSYEILDINQVELEREALNGKLFRILVKLSMINDRPELRLDPSWSDTGDRYMLKLFREYLFHQVNEDGTPWLDTGHVVSTLMKFDAGSPEKICLISRDEQHVLVVSFAELRKCFENAFSDLQS